MERFICEDNYLQEMQNTVVPYITERRTDAQLPSFDGKLLHVATFTADSPRAEAVVVHGYTESIEKYHLVIRM